MMGFFDQMASPTTYGSGGNMTATQAMPPSYSSMGNMSAPQSFGSAIGGMVGNGASQAAPTMGSSLGGAVGGAIGQATAPVVSPVNQATLTSMYQHMLGRMPDQSGMQGWTGMSQADVIRGIQNSPEYQQLHGMQTTPGVAVNGAPVGQPAPAPWIPGSIGQDAINTATQPLNYLSSASNPYNAGKEDYNTYALQMKNASAGLGQSIHDSFATQAPPANLAQLSQTPAWRAMTPDQQFRAMNPGTVAPHSQAPSTFQQAVSNITPYGAQYQRNTASNPLYQRQVNQNPAIGQMFQQQRMMQSPQTQNMYGNLYGGLSNLLRQHQGP